MQSLTRQQLQDIYAGTITNWKDVGGKDQEIIAFQRRADSGSQTLFQKLLIQDGPLMEAPTELAPTAMGELVDSIAEYNNSANAIGFSVYYYIDQMYSKPGLRLLAVDGVTPSNETIADQSYPLCNDFYAAIHQMPLPTARSAACTTGWTPTPAGLHQKVRLCGRRPADHRHHRGLKLTDLLSSATIKAGFCRSLCSRMLKGRSYYGTSLSPGRKPLAYLPAQPHYSGFQSAGSAVIRAGADWSAAQRCASDSLDAGLLFDGNEAEIRTFLERSLDIVIGIEFIKMLAKHSPGSSLEVLLYAIARHLVVGHDSAVENLLSVGAIALIFIVRKFFFVPAFGAHLPDGHPRRTLPRPERHPRRLVPSAAFRSKA